MLEMQKTKSAGTFVTSTTGTVVPAVAAKAAVHPAAVLGGPPSQAVVGLQAFGVGASASAATLQQQVLVQVGKQQQVQSAQASVDATQVCTVRP